MAPKTKKRLSKAKGGEGEGAVEVSSSDPSSSKPSSTLTSNPTTSNSANQPTAPTPETLPPTLSGSSLIKALKSPDTDPATKIALARTAWADENLLIPRKADVLRDWVLEAWGRVKVKPQPQGAKKGGKTDDKAGKKKGDTAGHNALLDPEYHLLFAEVSPKCAQGAEAMLSILETYVLSVRDAAVNADIDNDTTTSLLSSLGTAAASSFRILYHSDSYKADSWADVWAKLVDALATMPAGAVGALLPVAQIVVEGLRSTLPAANTKKIAQGLQAQLPAYATTLYRHEEVRRVFEPLSGTLFFPFGILQTVDPLKTTVIPLATAASAGTDPCAVLYLLPHLFSAFVSQTLKLRYELYARSTQSQQADVLVADRTRGAVVPALAASLELANRVEDTVARSGAASSLAPHTPLLEAVWRARLALWTCLAEWGGYLETDDAAGSLVAAEATRAAASLGPYATAETVSGATDEGLAGTVVRTLAVLEGLDHGRSGISADVIAWCLASPSRCHAASLTLLAAVLRFHSLTHSLGAFVSLLADAVATLFDSRLPTQAVAQVYTLVAAGPISDPVFRTELGAAARAANLGGRRGGVWAGLLDDLGSRARAVLAVESDDGSEESAKLKRKRGGEGSSDGARILAPQAALAAVLSRLVQLVLDAGSTARQGSGETESSIDALSAAFDVSVPPSSSSTPASTPTPKKKRKSTSGGAAAPATVQRDTALDLAFAARLRVARSARLLHRGNDDVDIDSLCLLENVGAELGLEVFDYLYTHLSLTAHADTDATQSQSQGKVVDALLTTLSAPSSDAWSGRTATVTPASLAAAVWTVVAQRGLAPFDVASPTQLDRLAGLLLSRAGDSPAPEAGLTARTAVERVLASADTWELPSLRAALLKSLASAAKPTQSAPTTGAFVVLTASPAPWLTRAARSALLEAAYARAPGADSDRVDVLRWLTRLAATDVLGPLSDAGLINQLLLSVSETDSAELIAAVLGLVKHAFRHIVRTAQRDPAVLMAVLDNMSDAFAKWATLESEPDCRSRALPLLLDEFTGPVDKFPSELRSRLGQVGESAHANLFRAASAALPIPLAHGDVFRAYRSLVRFMHWLSPAEATERHRQDHIGMKLVGELDRAERTSEAAELAVVALDLVASLVSATKQVTDVFLVAFIVLMPDFPSVSTGLEATLLSFAKTLSAEKFEELLHQCCNLTRSELSVEAALRAIRVLLSTPVEGSGRAIAGELHELLLVLEYHVCKGSVQILRAVLETLSALIEHRAGLLRAADAAGVISIVSAVLLPSESSALSNISESENRSPTSAPSLLTAALTPLMSLIRHRPDLVLAHLPALIGALSSAVPLLLRAQTALKGSRGVRASAARRPFWLASDPAEESDDVQASAALLARTLVTLSTAKLPANGQNATGPKSLAAPLAKHAPALLVSYARAASDPWSALSAPVRAELQPGLFALCDVITAGGRADGRGREGEGVGVPFGLGDSVGGEAEREIWVGVWRDWGRRRYTGRG